MKKLQKNQIGPWCSYCGPKISRATRRQEGFAGLFCCEAHKPEMEKDELDQFHRDQRVTEADNQTWIRL